MTTMAELNSLAKEYGFSTTVSSLTKLMEMGRADHSEEPKDRESIKALAGAGYAGGVMDLLKVDEGGVDPDSLEVRRHIFGENKIEHAPPKSYLELCWIAAQDSTLVLLEIAATVSLVLETSTADEDHIDTAWIEGTAIFVTIFVVINVTAFNDYKKEQQFRALKAKSEEGTKVPVFRKGNLASIPVNPDELVVGDIVDVKHGQVVQADGILLKADTPIAVDEAALTGESDVQIKDPQTGPFMLAGTSVRTGQGRMVVVAVGLNHTDGALTASITGAGASEAERQGEVERALDVNDGLSPHLMSDDENEGLVRSARRDAAKLEAKVNELAQAIERKRAVQQVAVTKRNNKKVAKMDAQIAELQAESEAKQNTANELRDAATALERAAGNDGNIVKLKEVIKKAHREVEGESNKAPEDDKDTVLTRKLEKLAWSIGGVASIMAVLCLVGLIIRLLITSYSDCDGCDNDGWGTDKWGEVVSFFIISVTVLVVAIPEGLPLAVTISLAYSVRKMQKDMCLVRVLASCETMGNAQHVCSDKTGTLTQNKMSVRAIFIGGEVYSTEDGTFEASRKLPEEILMGIAEQGSLNSSRNAGYIPKPKAATGKKDDPKKIPLEERVEEADKNNYRSEDSNEVEQVGSKTDCAILLLVDYYEPVTKSTYRDCRNRYGVAVKQFDFDHKKKRMSTVVERPNGVCFPQGTQRLYVKGAPSYLIDLCTKMSTAEGSVELTQERKDLIMNVISGFEDNAFRVLLLAYKDVDAQTDLDDEDNLVAGLTLQAITGIIDPARPEVIGALESCKKAGVTVRMVTGDSPKTATAIALNIGLLTKDEAANAEEGGYVMLGKDFENRVTTDPATGEVDWKEVSKIWPNLRVMGRCEPKHKEILVRGLKKDGEIVAVTGDGTNDAPALAKADVGFAMGLTGTPAAREASDIVLLDDNFASIVKAIKWGRNVYDSISKFLVFQLTVNVVAVIVAFIGSIAIGTTPLRATQMLWVNLIMDTFASLALATERPVEALLQRSPYPRDAPLLTKHMAKQILGHSVYQLIVLFTLLFEGYKWFDLDDGTKEDYDGPPTEHLTLVFNTFVWMTLFNQLNARRIDGNLNVFSGLDTNPMYLMIMGIEVVGQIIVVQFGGYAMRCRAQSGELWGVAIAFGAGSLIWNVVIHFCISDSWVPDALINIFKVTLEEEEEAAAISATGEDPKKFEHRVVTNDGIVTTITVEGSEKQMKELRKDGGLDQALKEQTEELLPGAAAAAPAPGPVAAALAVDEGSRTRSDSTGSGTMEAVGRALASKRVRSQLGREDTSVKINRWNELAASIRENNIGAKGNNDEISGPKTLWKATLDTIRAQMFYVNAFKDGVRRDSEEQVEGAAAADADLEAGVIVNRTESYADAVDTVAPAVEELDEVSES